MATKVFMEALSPTMEEGRLVKWLKNEGDAVKTASRSPKSRPTRRSWSSCARGGYVLKRIVPAGATVPVSELGGRHRRAGRIGGCPSGPNGGKPAPSGGSEDRGAEDRGAEGGSSDAGARAGTGTGSIRDARRGAGHQPTADRDNRTTSSHPRRPPPPPPKADR